MRRLRREWVLFTGGGLAALAACGLHRPASLAGALPVWMWCSWLLYRGLSDNRRQGEAEILPNLGLPTGITLLRGLLVATVAGFLHLPEVAAPAYTAAAILDCVDGRLARSRKRKTVLGAKLDLEVDAAGILVASLGGILLGKLPLWYASVGCARYLFVLGIAVRKRAGKPVRDLDPSRLRRLLAGVQMGFLAATLWPGVPQALSQAASFAFGGATLGMFARDWLFVSRTSKTA